jgi:hypothetical protein
LDALLYPHDLLIVEFLDLSVLYFVSAFEDPHRLRQTPAAVRVK